VNNNQENENIDTQKQTTNFESEKNLTPEIIKCRSILELDKSIRYAGICSSDGQLLASEYKKEITPLINGAELDFAVKISSIRAMERDVLSNKLGKPMYSIASYENVKRATISLNDGQFLLVSFERNVDDSLIIHKVMNEMNINYSLSLCDLGSRLAHQIQNPLSHIQNLINITKKHNFSRLEQDTLENFDLINKIILKLLHQTHDVTNFVKPEPLNLERNCSLSKVLNKTFNEIVMPNTVQVNMPEKDVTVKGDSKKLQIAFSNLIVNAIQAMNYNGKVNITIIDQNDRVSVEVEDSGPGIPDAILLKIFDPLFTTKEHGTGLGLVTCKSVVEKHGGKISVRNKPTVFTVNLPKS